MSGCRAAAVGAPAVECFQFLFFFCLFYDFFSRILTNFGRTKKSIFSSKFVLNFAPFSTPPTSFHKKCFSWLKLSGLNPLLRNEMELFSQRSCRLDISTKSEWTLQQEANWFCSQQRPRFFLQG